MKKIKFLFLLAIGAACLWWLNGTPGMQLSSLFDPKEKDEFTSAHVFAVERGSGTVLAEKQADEKAYPASLTKIMTALVALEHIDDLSAAAPVDIDVYREMVAQNASMAGFFGKEAVTYRDLLYGTVLSSGGEASNSLAIHTAGSKEAFVRLMNEKAAQIGLHHTRFTNVEGLHDPKQYTTAQDMALLLDHALQNGDFKAIFTKAMFLTSSTLDHPDGILLRSTVLDHLSEDEQDGFTIIGGKSGTTYEAGQCWATLSVIGDKEVISIVMGAPLKNIKRPDFAQKQDTLKLLKQAADGL